MFNFFVKKIKIVRVRRRRRSLRRPASPKSQKEYLENKEIARKIVLEKLEFWKNFYLTNFNINFVWNRVSIKNSKTRWGSCSSKNNLNFSYKIINLDEEEKNYLIIHELCHLKEMNHGANFWQLVAQGSPNFQELRHSMKSKTT